MKSHGMINDRHSPTSTVLKAEAKELSELGNWRRRHRVLIPFCCIIAPSRAQERNTLVNCMVYHSQDTAS